MYLLQFGFEIIVFVLSDYTANNIGTYSKRSTQFKSECPLLGDHVSSFLRAEFSYSYIIHVASFPITFQRAE